MSAKDLQHYCKRGSKGAPSSAIAVCAALFVLSAATLNAQSVRRLSGADPASSPLKPLGSGVKDPGPRGGPPGAGGTFTVLDNTNSAADQADHDFFAEAFLRFQEVDSVSGTIEGGSGPWYENRQSSRQ